MSIANLPRKSVSNSPSEDSAPDEGEGDVLLTPTASEPRRRRAVPFTIAFAVLLLLLLVTGVVAVSGGGTPSTPLGAAATLHGGAVRVSGVIPLENDGWLPPDGSTVLSGSAPEGLHRVRIALSLTALEPEGITFSAAESELIGLGPAGARLLWADPEGIHLAQGESSGVTMVFEIPDRGVELTLELDDEARLALGVGHHSAAR